MRKVILFNMISLDGYFEGPDHDLNWHKVDEEFDQFAIEQINTAGALIFGRVTYQLMADFWSTPNALESDPDYRGADEYFAQDRFFKNAGYSGVE